MCAGIDFSKSMLDLAQANIDELAARADAPLPGVMLLPGDAQALPFQQSTVEETGGLFDVVVCNFGVLHLGEPQKFFAEAFRVPAPANTSLYLAAHIYSHCTQRLDASLGSAAQARG